MNRRPRSDRELYPKQAPPPTPGVVRAYWLEVEGALPAKSAYDAWKEKPRVLATLAAIDTLASRGQPVPTHFLEWITQGNIKLGEVKAPQRGVKIFRLLVYRPEHWNLFIAFAEQKTTQKLPSQWLKTAAQRVKRALNEGGEL